MGIWDFLSSLAEFSAEAENIVEGVEDNIFRLFKNIFKLHRKVTQNVDTLKRKHEVLSSREEDVKDVLENEEFHDGKRRRREVQTWLNYTESKKNDVQIIVQNAGQFEPLAGLFIGTSVERNLEEVDELLRSEFPNGLTIDVLPTKEPLLTRALIGRDTNVRTIMAGLSDSSVVRIGVYGEKGDGKTAILSHIHDELLRDSGTAPFRHVYWVSVPERPCVLKLQDAIARQAGLNLSGEEDMIMRTAKLRGRLNRKGKGVIILDGVIGELIIEEIGIPNEENQWKLILSTPSRSNCQKMDCDVVVELEPLSDGEAMELFRKKLSRRNSLGPEFDDVCRRVVHRCRGSPRQIISMAERLRAVRNVDEWNTVLAELS